MSLQRLKLLVSMDSARSCTDRIPYAAFAAAFVGSAGLGAYFSTSTEECTQNRVEEDGAKSNSHWSDSKSLSITESCYHSSPMTNPDSSQTPHFFATSPVVEKDDASSEKNFVSDESKIECDFAIVGYGNAGSAAVASLKQLCPRASIAVIDPIGVPASGYVVGQGGDVTRKKEKRMKFFPLSAEHLDHKDRTLTLSDGTKLKFQQSVLLATGSRGAPPPLSLMDPQAMERVLELRSTEFSTRNGFVSPLSPRRPIMSPQGVRQISIMAAAQGARICVLGSGIEAVELAVAAAYSGNKNIMKRKTKRTKLGENDEEAVTSKVSLVFGNAGPLSTRLPRYLSTAVSKRLRQHSIDVRERSLVRYVAMTGLPLRTEALPCLEIHTAKSYDTLDTARTNTDLLVVAPSVDGQMGTAVIPTGSGTRPEVEGDALTAPSYEPWSNLMTPNQRVLSCYVDDGRIVVNKELNAASRVFAAGSVARHPGNSGHATVSGEGFLDGMRAGEVAAHNMAREYNERQGKKGCNGKLSDARIFSEESFPIWRTDVCSYATSNSPSNKSTVQSHLSSVGVNALCIGHCDSETMSTHGLWWTNQSSESRRKLAFSDKLKAGTLVSRRSTKRSSMYPRAVYGSGIVYYLDRSGTIRGIMVWGLPFTQSGGTDLNNHLVERIKAVLTTNGTICLEQHDKAVEQQGGGKHNCGLLTTTHLSEESKLLASIALSGSNQSPGEIFSGSGIGEIAKPLHRYVPSKPSHVTSIGVLKRNADDIGTGGVGEDIFVRNDVQKETGRPQSLVYVYPMEWTNNERSISVDEASYAQEGSWSRGKSGDFEARSRPPKEEPMWLRRGESNKAVSMNDVLADVFRLNVRRGRFHDGTDAVVQAPVPQVIQDAKKKFLDFKSGDSPEVTPDGGQSSEEQS